MMGVGTPMAEQVKVTVSPRDAVMDSSGEMVTVGGAVMRAKNIIHIFITSLIGFTHLAQSYFWSMFVANNIDLF